MKLKFLRKHGQFLVFTNVLCFFKVIVDLSKSWWGFDIMYENLQFAINCEWGLPKYSEKDQVRSTSTYSVWYILYIWKLKKAFCVRGMFISSINLLSASVVLI